MKTAASTYRDSSAIRRSSSRSVQSSGSDSTMRRKLRASGPSRGRCSSAGCATPALAPVSAAGSCAEAMASARLARLCSDEAMSGAQTATSEAIDVPLDDYRVLTGACGLIDRSERGKLALSGAGAVEFLNGQVTNELDDLRAGEGRYAAFLTHKGKMLGDLRILAVGPPGSAPPRDLWLDTERVSLQALFDMIRRFKVGFDVQLHKRTLECGLLSLIGREADAVAGVQGLGVDEHANAALQIDGIDVLAVRAHEGVDL